MGRFSFNSLSVAAERDAMTEEERVMNSTQIQIANASLARAVLYVENDDPTHARLDLEEAKHDIEMLLIGFPSE